MNLLHASDAGRRVLQCHCERTITFRGEDVARAAGWRRTWPAGKDGELRPVWWCPACAPAPVAVPPLAIFAPVAPAPFVLPRGMHEVVVEDLLRRNGTQAPNAALSLRRLLTELATRHPIQGRLHLAAVLALILELKVPERRRFARAAWVKFLKGHGVMKPRSAKKAA